MIANEHIHVLSDQQLADEREICMRLSRELYGKKGREARHSAAINAERFNAVNREIQRRALPMTTKPTPQQARLAEKSKDVPIVKQYDGEETTWSFANGDKCRKDVVENCIARGLIAPVGDGLFGDSQTFAAVL